MLILSIPIAAEAQDVPAVTGVFFGSRPQSGDTYKASERIQAVVTYSGHVTVTGTPRLALAIGNRIRQAAFDSVAVTGGLFGASYLYFNYDVQSSDRDADGIGIDPTALILSGGTIRDARGADALLDLPDLAIANDARHKVDGRRNREPSVIDVTIRSRPRSGNTYGRGERIRVGVRFSESVTVGGTPRLALTVGTATRGASHTSGGGGVPWLWFHYDVQAADRDADGISLGPHALHLNGGAIRDAGGADALLDLGRHAFSSHGGHRVNGAANHAPAVTDVFFDSVPRDGETYEHGEQVSVRVFFDKIVAVTGAPTLTLSIGTQSRPATFGGLSWSNTEGWSALRFRYYVQAEDGDRDGIGIGAGALRLNGGYVRDPAGNDARLDFGRHAIDNAAGHAVDGGERSSADRNGFSPD